MQNKKYRAQPLAQKTKAESVLSGFSNIWSSLFQTPIHLDSALSKQNPSIKRILAQILPPILLRPVSLAEALGIGVPLGEPWTLSPQQKAEWRPAKLMAERLYEMMVERSLEVTALEEDFPPSMVSEWLQSWNAGTRSELIRILSKEAPLGLRASRKVGASSLLKSLSAESKLPVRAVLSPLTPLGIRLAGYAPILGTSEYEAGSFEIQDEGSQFMALFALWPELYGGLLQQQPGAVQNLDLAPPLPSEIPVSSVVDACAGAGGKSLAIADVLKGKGRVFAYDVSLKKLQALRRRATRAGLNNIQAVSVKEGEEQAVVGAFKESAQVVLVDAPCSGWGVLRRNPDIKWRQPPEVLDRMPIIQSRLLSSYAGLVAPKGRLVYGVCTFRLAETREVVTDFLKKHPQFVAQEGGFLGPDPCDGFFMQSFLRAHE